MSRSSLIILSTFACTMSLSTLSASAQMQVASVGSSITYSSSASGITAPPAAIVKAAPMRARPFSGIGFDVKVGSGGIGFDVATPLVPRYLNLRSGASFFTYTPSTITTDNLNIDGQIKLQNAAVMVDYFPFHGRFRLSGGATLYNNTGLTATITEPTGQAFTVGGVTYYSEPYNAITNPAGPVMGTGSFVFGGNKVVPRVTIGTGNLLNKKGRFTFQSEIGFQYFSAPTVNYILTGTGCLNDTAGVYTNCGPIPQSNINDEQVKLQNDLSGLRFFPIVSVGVGFRIH